MPRPAGLRQPALAAQAQHLAALGRARRRRQPARPQRHPVPQALDAAQAGERAGDRGLPEEDERRRVAGAGLRRAQRARGARAPAGARCSAPGCRTRPPAPSGSPPGSARPPARRRDPAPRACPRGPRGRPTRRRRSRARRGRPVRCAGRGARRRAGADRAQSGATFTSAPPGRPATAFTPVAAPHLQLAERLRRPAQRLDELPRAELPRGRLDQLDQLSPLRHRPRAAAARRSRYAARPTGSRRRRGGAQRLRRAPRAPPCGRRSVGWSGSGSPACRAVDAAARPTSSACSPCRSRRSPPPSPPATRSRVAARHAAARASAARAPRAPRPPRLRDTAS